MEDTVFDNKPKIDAYKAVCFKLGFIMCVYYICRILAGFVISFLDAIWRVESESALNYFVRSVIMLIYVYVIPLVVSMHLFKNHTNHGRIKRNLNSLYKAPKHIAKSLGNFAAMYGLGQGINFLTILLVFIASGIIRRVGVGIELERYFEQIAVELPTNFSSALIMVYITAIVGPIVEEFWVRGIMYDALKQYGNGIAILISSLLFGLMHSSLTMLFYTTALGFALGYIRYATDSLFVVTILHIMFNSVAAGMMFLMSMTDILGEGSGIMGTVSSIYLLAMFVLVIIGVTAFIKRISTIRKYRIENSWRDVSASKKVAMFFVSVPVIVMIVLAFDAHANYFLLERVIGLFL